MLDENKQEIEIRELDDEDEDMDDALPAGEEPAEPEELASSDAPAAEENEDIDLDERSRPGRRFCRFRSGRRAG